MDESKVHMTSLWKDADSFSFEEQKHPSTSAMTESTTAGILKQYMTVEVRESNETTERVSRHVNVEEVHSKYTNIDATFDTQNAPSRREHAIWSIDDTEVDGARRTAATTRSIPQERLPDANTWSTTAASSPISPYQQTVAERFSSTTSKPPQPGVTSSTERARASDPKAARTRLNLRGLSSGSSRLLTTFAPDWDMKDGHAEHTWSSDEEEDDEDENGDDDRERRDEETDRRESRESPQASNRGGRTGPRVLVGGPTVVNQDAHRAQAGLVPRRDVKQAEDTIFRMDKSPIITEMEVQTSESEKPFAFATARARSLQSHYKDWSRYIIYTVMLIFPLLFIVIAIMVAFGHKKATDSSYVYALERAIEIAISAWPIIFAGIVAQSLRAYATFRVERGVRLMTLEQLVNSSSVAASLKQPFLLRRFNWVTLALVILWGLSPLATQAMQRLSSSANLIIPITLRYQDTLANGMNYLAADANIFFNVKADFERVWHASQLVTQTQYAIDPFGNALIPLLGDSPSHMQYLSLIGVPIASAEYATDSPWSLDSFEITIPTAYLNVACDNFTVLDPTTNDTDRELFGDLTNRGSPGQTLFVNMTAMEGQRPGRLAFASLITRNTTDYNNSFPIDINAVDYNRTYAYTSCSFSQEFVNATIYCRLNQCYTTRVVPTSTSNNTIDDYTYSGAENWMTIMLGDRATNLSNPIPTDFELFLNQTEGDVGLQTPGVNLTSVPSLGDSIFTLLNTWWLIGFAPRTLTFLMPNSTNNDDFHLSGGIGPIAYKISMTDADATLIDGEFVVVWGWLVLLIVCSTALLLAGIFSIWWDVRTVSPDVLGFASSVVHKNKYVDLPKVDNVASGAERARKLGQVRVMMQDVKPKAEVGRIALGTFSENAARLKPGRSYR